MDPTSQSRALHEEADRILHERGLLALLARYGRPEVTGSHRLDLMTWRDLDLYVVAEAWTVDRFLEMGRVRLRPLSRHRRGRREPRPLRRAGRRMPGERRIGRGGHHAVWPGSGSFVER